MSPRRGLAVARPLATLARRLSRFVLVAPLPFAALTGCAAGNGSFKADGFHQADYPYVVHYGGDAQKQQLLGADWRLDNYVLHDDGTPGSAKTTREYRGVRVLHDKEGKANEEDVYVFDVKLVNRRTDAVIWAQSLPLEEERADKDLRVLLEQFAERTSGTGLYTVKAVEGEGRELRARTYATKIVSGEPKKIGGLEAYDAVLELANADQLRLDPTARTQVARIVLVRSNAWKYRFPTASSVAIKTRGVLLFGCAASPQHFEETMPDCERFLSLVDVRPVTSEKTSD